MKKNLNKIKLYIADTHAILRDGIKSLFEEYSNYAIVGESDNGLEAMEEIESIKPDILILEISLPEMSGIEIARQLKRYRPEIKIIILTSTENDIFLQELLEISIDGFVVKNNSFDDLLRAVRSAIAGNLFMSPEVTARLVSGITHEPQGEVKSIFELLSPRENEVLKLLAEGVRNDEIAAKLRISTYTVKKHRNNIMKKLDIHNLADLTRFAIKAGIIDLG